MSQKSRLELALERKQKADELVKTLKAQVEKKNRKVEDRKNVLCGLMFKGLITDGSISQEQFDSCVSKYLNERDQKFMGGRFDEFLAEKKSEGAELHQSSDMC